MDPKNKTNSAPADIEVLKAENEQLRSQLASGKLPEDMEQQVRERMDGGLDREQAIAATRAQQQWDKDPLNPANQTDTKESK